MTVSHHVDVMELPYWENKPPAPVLKIPTRGGRPAFQHSVSLIIYCVSDTDNCHCRNTITAPLTQVSSLHYHLSYPFFSLLTFTASPDQGSLSTWVGPPPFFCAFDLQVSLSFPSVLSSPATSRLRPCFGY